jgi:hypothetical protein
MKNRKSCGKTKKLHENRQDRILRVLHPLFHVSVAIVIVSNNIVFKFVLTFSLLL